MNLQEYVVPFRVQGHPAGSLPRTARLAAKSRPSDRSNERRSVLRAIDARRAGEFALFMLSPLPKQTALFYHEVHLTNVLSFKNLHLGPK